MSEFINIDDDIDPVTKECDEASSQYKYLMYVVVVVLVLLIMVLFMSQYGDDCAALFQGSFPVRSDIGSDRFDLQKEVDNLTEKQMNNVTS